MPLIVLMKPIIYRFITIGLLQNALVQIVTSETENEIRIISMRKAEKHELTKYYENINR